MKVVAGKGSTSLDSLACAPAECETVLLIAGRGSLWIQSISRAIKKGRPAPTRGLAFWKTSVRVQHLFVTQYKLLPLEPRANFFRSDSVDSCTDSSALYSLRRFTRTFSPQLGQESFGSNFSRRMVSSNGLEQCEQVIVMTSKSRLIDIKSWPEC